MKDLSTNPLAFQSETARNESGEFAGFERPDASFIMCPNEFLDLLIPNCSRGCVRLVAYVLYETLRWINDDGTPNSQEIEIPFNQLIRNVGISRGAATTAKTEAIENNFIEIVTDGLAKSKGESGSTTKVKLKWSSQSQPAQTIGQFEGFYSGTGHFTAMPHSYFSRIIPNETLSAIRFVSIVFRFTEGYQTQFGRRKSIPLSFKNIYKLANIRSSSVLSQTIRHCVNSNFVELVHAGSWAPGEGESKAAVYGPKYANQSGQRENGSKSEADHRFKKRSGLSVQKTKPDQFKNRSKGGSKTEAEDAFKNRSPIKKTENKLQTKQVDGESQKLLIAAGFKDHIARKIALSAEREVIENQIQWMRFRKNVEKPLGFLKKAIEQNWEEPEERRVRQKDRRIHQERVRNQQKNELEESKLKQKVAQHRNRLVEIWNSLPPESREIMKQRAIQVESESCRGYLRKKSVEERPPIAFLNQVAEAESLPTTAAFEAQTKQAETPPEIAA